MKRNKEEALAFLRENHGFLLICHDNPDGDTLGSALGLFFALKKLGKDAQIACGDPVPDKYRVLPGWEKVRFPGEIRREYHAVIFVDCADTGLFRKSRELMLDNSLCIDHHISNTGYAAVTYCAPTAAAVGQLMLDLILGLDVPLDHKIAQCLFCAISTDTGHFAFSNTTKETFCAAAELMEYDLDIAELCRQLYRLRSPGNTRLIGRCLSRMETVCQGRGAYMEVSQADLRETGAAGFETEGLIDFLRDMEGVELCALIKELSDGTCKVSLRSNGGVDASQEAGRFHGGGHRGAAGFSLAQPLSQAKRTVALLMESLL